MGSLGVNSKHRLKLERFSPAEQLCVTRKTGENREQVGKMSSEKMLKVLLEIVKHHETKRELAQLLRLTRKTPAP